MMMKMSHHHYHDEGADTATKPTATVMATAMQVSDHRHLSSNITSNNSINKTIHDNTFILFGPNTHILQQRPSP